MPAVHGQSANDRFPPIADMSDCLHAPLMQLLEPRALQYRTAAISLFVIAALGAFRLAITWLHSLAGPLTLPLLIAFLIFNAGYVWTGTRIRFETTGARLGALAVALNLLTMVFPVSPLFWTAVSSVAAALALVGAGFLLKDASRAPA